MQLNNNNENCMRKHSRNGVICTLFTFRLHLISHADSPDRGNFPFFEKGKRTQVLHSLNF